MTLLNKCPKCKYTSDNPFSECPACGLLIEKFKEKEIEKQNYLNSVNSNKIYENDGKIFRDLFFNIQPNIGIVGYIGRLIILLALIYWSFKLIFSSIISNYAGKCLLHMVNLPFHEAGHVVFSFFGSFIHSLGGTLGQFIMPLICMITFIVKNKDSFSGAVCFWWFSENFIDIAPYVNDARAGILPLVGGNTGQSSPYGFHDWNFILNESGLLKYDTLIAKFSFFLGTVLIIVSLIWACFLMKKQYRYIEM